MSQKDSMLRRAKGILERGTRRARVAAKNLSRDWQSTQKDIEKLELDEDSGSVPHVAQSLLHFAVHRGATFFFYGVVEPFWTTQLANAYRFVTAGKTYMSASDIQSARRALKAGDIVAARNEAAATTNFIEWFGSRWTHVGIYVGNGKVLEALDNEGVVLTTLPKFMRRYTRVAVYRPAGEWEVEKALAFGTEQVGKGYNFSFIFNDKSFYCSQLLYRVFSAGGFELAKPRTNRMGYPIVSPDELIYDNRERLELIWSVGHEIFRVQGEAVAGITKMTGQMVFSALAEKGIVFGKVSELADSVVQKSGHEVDLSKLAVVPGLQEVPSGSANPSGFAASASTENMEDPEDSLPVAS